MDHCVYDGRTEGQERAGQPVRTEQSERAGQPEKKADPGKTGKKVLRGYFTVEITLLMTMILPLLLAVILMGFYVHDNARMQGTVCETAAMGSNLLTYKDRSSSVRKTAASGASSAAIWAKGVKATVSYSEKYISVSCSGTFHFPTFIAVFLSDTTSALQKKWDRKLYQPAKLIRKVRGVGKLADLLTS